MDAVARGELLIKYAKGPAQLRTALERYPKESLDFKPGPGKWSIQDIILHVAETEVHFYLRGRTIVNEPGTAIRPFDQDLWARSLDVSAQPLGEAVELVRLLREMTARQLRALPEAAWERHGVHPEKGKITLERWLEICVGHLDTHLAQLERTHQAFLAKR